VNAATIAFLLGATLRLGTPLLLAALGGAFAERAGVITICLEAMLLSAAFAAFAVSVATGNAWLGVPAGIVAGALVASLHAVLSCRFRANQIVTGVAINIAALGATSLLYEQLFGISTTREIGPSIPPLSVPGLSELPAVGESLFQVSPIVLMALALVPVCWLVFNRTRTGLAVRAVGEHPTAADTSGISVLGVRYGALVACGALAGLGGAFLTVGQQNAFFPGMTAGIGYIAYAALILGKWDPRGVLVAALGFGLAGGLGLRLQTVAPDIPFQAFLMLPYVVTLLVLAVFGARGRYPSAAGIPYG
jgi:simple sugar transport system permease protein